MARSSSTKLAFLVAAILFLAMSGSVSAAVPLSSKASVLAQATCTTADDCKGPACVCDKGKCYCGERFVNFDFQKTSSAATPSGIKN